MKIAWLNEHMNFFNGGIRYIYEVTRRLRQEYEDVTIVTGGISFDNLRKFSDANIVVSQCFDFVNSKVYWLFYPFYLFKNALLWRNKEWSRFYDVIFSSSPTTHIICLLAGIKPILVVFELNPWLYSESYQQGLPPLKRFIIKFWNPIAKYMEKKAYQNAVRIIAYSKFVQSEIKRVYGVDSEVIYTGIDTEFFKK